MIALCVMTDGRTEYLRKTLAALDQLEGPISQTIIHDDTETKRGFAGAYHHAWEELRLVDEDWIFSIEDDMVLTRPVNLGDLVTVMESRPYLAQMALKRQAWNDTEKIAGGVVEVDPDAFESMVDGPFQWLEHTRFFTTNAFLVNRSLLEAYDWPLGPRSEGVFSHRLVADGYRFGYWGSKTSLPAVTHIGERRVGHGY